MSFKKWPPTLIAIFAIVIILAAITLFSLTDPMTQRLLFLSACIIIFALLSLIWRQKPLPFQNANTSSYQTPVLLVDDNKANRRIIIEMLKPLNIIAIEADNGDQALELFKKNSFALILMDIEMPQMNGLEVTKAMRELEGTQKRTPIVAISAHSSNDKKLVALTAGFDEYLIKPINNEQLVKTLDRWFNLSGIHEKPKKQTNFSQITLSDYNYSISPDTKNAESKPKIENAAVEFIKKTSIDAGGTIKKVVDVKQSLIFSRNNHELAKDMLSMLIQLIKDERSHINTLYRNKKWQELGELVHKINGGSCYCGVPELQKKTQLLDKALEQNKIELAVRHFPDFLKALDELIEWSDEHDIDIIFGN